MAISLAIVYGLLMIFIILRSSYFTKSGLSKQFLAVAFLAKIAGGMAYYLLFLYYPPYQGTSDAIRFFEDSASIFKAFHHDKMDFFSMISGIGDDHYYYQKYYKDIFNWYRIYQTEIFNDNRTIIRLNALIRIISMGYYPIHILIANFLSFMGLVGLYRFFIEFYKGKQDIDFYKGALAVLLFFFPSMLLWGSGVTKEALSLFGTGIFLFFSGKLFRHEMNPGGNLIFFLIALYFMIFLKIYMLLLLFPLFLAFFWASKESNFSTAWKYSIVIILCLVMVANIQLVFPGFRVAEILAQKQKDFYAMALYTSRDPLSIVPDLNNSFLSLISAAIPAFLNALTGPLIVGQLNYLNLAGLLENILLLGLLLTPFFFHKPLDKNTNMFFFCLLYFAMIFVLVGLISPLPGAIMRYRVMALPFLFNAICLLFDRSMKKRSKA
jgi:hypothetical protein